MKKSIKRFLSIMVIAAMVTVTAAACGSKEKEAEEPDQAGAEVESESADESDAGSEDAQAEAPAEMTEEQKGAEAEREAMIKYNKEVLGKDINEEYDETAALGVPDDILQQLYDSVRTSVTEEYLKKYGIAPEGFQWPEDNAGWRYLQDLIEQKIMFLKDNMTDEPTPQPEKFEVDPQTAELMDIVYNQIISWIQTNDLYLFNMYYIQWSEVIRPHITF